MHVHRAQVAQIVVLPDGFQKVFAAENLAAVADEQLKQIEFLRREVDLLLADGHRAVVQVDAHVAHRQNRLSAFLLHHRGAAEDGLDAALDLEDVERLGHIIVRAVFETQNLVHVLALGGEHDDRHRGFFADALAHLNAVYLGQHDVQKHKIIAPGEKFVQRFLAVHCGIRFIIILFKGIFESLHDQRFVVYDQYFACHPHSSVPVFQGQKPEFVCCKAMSALL